MVFSRRYNITIIIYTLRTHGFLAPSSHRRRRVFGSYERRVRTENTHRTARIRPDFWIKNELAKSRYANRNREHDFNSVCARARVLQSEMADGSFKRNACLRNVFSRVFIRIFFF